MQVDIDLGSAGVLGSEVGNDLALSPDGERLVFVALLPDGSTRLYARRLAELTAVELPGTVGARGPFFSPDGRSVGFWAQGSLKKTLVGGGSPVAIVTASDLQGASWGENDEIIATLDSTGRLFRVSVDGGEPLPVFEPAPGTSARWPQHLPGGAILFTQTRGAQRAACMWCGSATARRARSCRTEPTAATCRAGTCCTWIAALCSRRHSTSRRSHSPARPRASSTASSRRLASALHSSPLRTTVRSFTSAFAAAA